MPRVQVYLPDDLYAELKSRDLPASELLQIALRAEIERRNAMDSVDEYVAELAAEVGAPTKQDRLRAQAIVRRVQDRPRPSGRRAARSCSTKVGSRRVGRSNGRTEWRRADG
jgi:post-segregation antitoxin (ccd killing protein)